jgi:hypothetical protein
MTRADRITRIRIELDDTDPVIWRLVEVPLATSLKGNRRALGKAAYAKRRSSSR